MKSLSGTGISKSQVLRLCEEIDGRVTAFLDRPIEGVWPYLWVDAIYVKVRQAGRIVSVAVIIASSSSPTATRASRRLPTKILTATWQRCRVHFMRNVLAHAGGQGRRVVSAFIATAFRERTTPTEPRQQWRRAADQVRPKVPKLAALMDDAEPEEMAK